jgi:hypothetical protein
MVKELSVMGEEELNSLLAEVKEGRGGREEAVGGGVEQARKEAEEKARKEAEEEREQEVDQSRRDQEAQRAKARAEVEEQAKRGEAAAKREEVAAAEAAKGKEEQLAPSTVETVRARSVFVACAGAVVYALHILYIVYVQMNLIPSGTSMM